MGPLSLQSFGLGSVAQVQTGEGAFGHYLSINLGFGLAVAMGVYVGGKVSGMRDDTIGKIRKHFQFLLLSCHIFYYLCIFAVPGAHMNGAVSFTMCVFHRLKWKMLPLYILAQLLASFLAAGTIYAVYYGEETKLFMLKHTRVSL